MTAFGKSFKDLEIEQERMLLKRLGFQHVFLDDLYGENRTEYQSSFRGTSKTQETCQLSKSRAIDNCKAYYGNEVKNSDLRVLAGSPQCNSIKGDENPCVRDAKVGCNDQKALLAKSVKCNSNRDSCNIGVEETVCEISNSGSSTEPVPNLQNGRDNSVPLTDQCPGSAGSTSNFSLSSPIYKTVIDYKNGGASDKFSADYELALQCLKEEQFCDSLIFIDATLKDEPSSAELWALKAKVMNAMEDPLEALRAVSEVKVAERSPDLITEGLIALNSLHLTTAADLWRARYAQVGDSQPDNSKPSNVLKDHVHKDIPDEDNILISDVKGSALSSNDEFGLKQPQKLDKLAEHVDISCLTSDFSSRFHVSEDNMEYRHSGDGSFPPSNSDKSVFTEGEKATIDNILSNAQSSLEDGGPTISGPKKIGGFQNVSSCFKYKDFSSKPSSDDGSNEKDMMLEFYEQIINEKKAPILVTKESSNEIVKLQASRKIREGEMLFLEIPEFFEQDITSCHISACANCGLSLAKPEEVFTLSELATPKLKKAVRKYWKKREIIPCGSCRRAAYCSQQCRSEAWERREVKIFKRDGWILRGEAEELKEMKKK